MNKKRAYTLVEQGIYSSEVFLERSKELTSAIDDKEKALKAIRLQINTIDEMYTRRNEFVPRVQNILDVYHMLKTPAEKNALLKEIVEKAVYDKDKSGAFKGCSSSDFELTLYPKIPKARK